MRVWLSPHNTKYIVLLAIACLVALSIYIHSRGSKDKKELLNKINFLPSIPESINNTIKDVKVFDRFVNITFNEHTVSKTFTLLICLNKKIQIKCYDY